MRSTASVLVFLCGLIAGTAVLRQTIKALPSQTQGAIEHLAAHGDDYDVVVVGSSLTRRNFVPAVFDERMAQLGHPVRSFGFGLDDARGAELHYYVERVLQLPLRRLRCLLVDVSLDQDRWQPDEGTTRRAIAWHAPAQTWLAIRHPLAQREPASVQVVTIAGHVRHLLLNRGNVGLGLEALHTGFWTEPAPRPKTFAALVAGAFHAHDEPAKVARYLRVRSRHEAARRRVEYLRRTHADDPPGVYPQAERELARARGTPIVFLLSAVLFDARFDPKVPGDEPLRVIDLNDPARYPKLYAPDMRYDALHLTYAGSVLYTRAIADTLATQWASELSASLDGMARP